MEGRIKYLFFVFGIKNEKKDDRVRLTRLPVKPIQLLQVWNGLQLVSLQPFFSCLLSDCCFSNGSQDFSPQQLISCSSVALNGLMPGSKARNKI